MSDSIDNIEKSLTDNKSYRVIQLKNGLKAVLISDVKSVKSDIMNVSTDEEGIQKSAAALCINIGSFSDPFELQGLAHYLEHMVFMGSEKYPTENDFDACVQQHGGSSNAWTDCERTLFYFDCHTEHFESVLDKFANFFISPLLLKDSMDRELTAVNSEFEMSYSKDVDRIFDLLQSTAKESSPCRIFCCGNVRSLKKEPTKNGVDIYRCLNEFRQRMYSADWMTLAVQSRDTLDNIEAMVRDIFEDINCNGQPLPDMSIHCEPFNTAQFNRFYNVVSIKDFKFLKLTWPLPPVQRLYRAKPMEMIGHLLGYEGPGSLTTYLRKINYIVDLEAGSSGGGFESSSFNSLISVGMRLTDVGYEHVMDIVELVFAFLNLMRQGIPERIYLEYQQIQQNQFNFKEQDEPVGTVEQLAQNLQLYEPQHIISGSDVVFEIKPELYQELLQIMTVDRVNIMLLSRSFDTEVTESTKWYDVRHAGRDFTDVERRTWSCPRIVADLHLPLENKFLANNFDMISITDDGVDEVPIDLARTTFSDLAGYGELWHQHDPVFRVPKAIVNFHLKSPRMSESAYHECLIDLLLYALNQQLSTTVYDALVAGIRNKVVFQDNGLLIKLDGFNDKIPVLFTTIIDHLANMIFDDNDKLSVYKETVRQVYYNMAIKPNILCGLLQRRICLENEWLVTEKMKLLKSITLDDLNKFHADLFRDVTIKSYFHGNISIDVAKNCFEYAVSRLAINRNNEYTLYQSRCLPTGSSNVRVMNLNSSDVNTATMVIYQMGPGSIRLQTFNELIRHVLSEPCFNFLRTKETLGYDVGIIDSTKRGNLGICVYVMSQANKFPVDHCTEKIEHFFEHIVKEIISNMSDEDFKEFKISFVANKLVEDNDMSDSEERNWKEIIRNEYVFDRRFAQVELAESISKEDLLHFFQQFYVNDESQRKLIVEVDSVATDETVTDIMDDAKSEFDIRFVQPKAGKNFINLFDIISSSKLYPLNFITA